jgi:hypothetical protein
VRQRTSAGVRLGSAAASLLLLTLGAACSADAGSPSGSAPTPTASASSAAPATAAPGPSKTPTLPPPPATTPVPAATPGNVNSTVPSKPEKTKKPVKLDRPSTTGTGLTVNLTSIEPINAKAEQPGEVAGPGLAITITVKNTGSKSADLSTLVVNVANSDDAPGTQMSAKPSRPLAGSVAAGKTKTGVYVFTVSKDKRKPVTVTVDIAGAPVLAFTGNAA